MRAPRSSYGPVEREKPREKRGPQPKARVKGRGKYAQRWVDGKVGTPPTQEERVEWARREYRTALNRANAKRKADLLLNAIAEARKRDLDLAIHTLEVLRARGRTA